ncbi:DNA methyltransferase [Paractinoplanes durhamensis]|uniref:DNA methylase N-4/N-6 domain-containing protein n=1 Tax=Paractinoplanes durhamensis TaxID=113563 RepID=A0ABQ3YU64_9ACTN|nr:DNA methyltransferase [Actinoplanes durhamensis]GIE01142.1 hypothetical protein Adu01nite_24920 [Actinoplanes durhamensis]
MSRLTDLLRQLRAIEPGLARRLETEIAALADRRAFGLNFERHSSEAGEPIHPGLVSTGKIELGGDKPFHAVINAENEHALRALLFTHRGRVDCIYLDPPYNTGAKDWKYNNHYVADDDRYRHSKWLSFMERRLLLARELLNPADSVLIVTIDEKEYLRLGLLLEQTFPDGRMQMVSSVINPAGAGRAAEFARTDEYIFFVRIGRSRVLADQRQEERRPVTWDTLRRSDIASRRGTAKGGPSQFFPIYVDRRTGFIAGIGEPLPGDMPRTGAPVRPGCVAVFPVRPDGTEMNWGLTPDAARNRLRQGYLRAGRRTAGAPQEYAIGYLTGGIVSDIEAGHVEVTGRAPDGSVVAGYVTGRLVMPTTAWNRPSHDAQRFGTEILKDLLPGRRFPFPKSLYAVEDCLRHFLADKPAAVVVDFFAGSGTTTHATFRLNRQDGGRRTSIAITNNEVAEGEQAGLRARGLHPGDPQWEARGICEHITKPRTAAAATGRTPEGMPVKGDYRFTDEFPMAAGFEENIEFFTLTYDAGEFTRIAPLLWMRAGARGRRIEDVSAGWAVADSYGILADPGHTEDFIKALDDRVEVAFVVTEDDPLFESVAHALPAHVEPVHLRSFDL